MKHAIVIWFLALILPGLLWHFNPGIPRSYLAYEYVEEWRFLLRLADVYVVWQIACLWRRAIKEDVR